MLDRDFSVVAENIESGKRVEPNSIRRYRNKFSLQGNLGQAPFEIGDLELNLLGLHQVTNAALAVVATKLFAREQRRPLNDGDIRKGLATAHLMGRTETLCVAPVVVIDMAHNVASIAALIDTLTTQLPGWKTASSRRLIMATSRDKDAQGMLRLLIRHFDEIVFTRYLNNPRGKSPAELLEIAVHLRDQMNLATVLSVDPNPQSAWYSVREKTGSDDIICISGSAFLVAELRQTVLDSDPIG